MLSYSPLVPRSSDDTEWAIQDLNLKSQPAADKPLSKNQQNQEVHNPVHLLTIYPELGQIITAWPELSEQDRKAILDIVKG